MKHVDIAGGKYTLVYDPHKNDRLVQVLRYGEKWQTPNHGIMSKWLVALLYEVLEAAEGTHEFEMLDVWEEKE